MKGRKRGKDRPDDPEGLLKSIGVERIQWTNPDKVTGNPGAKPIERAFREDFADPTNEVRKLAPEQRELLKRVPAAVTPNRRSGEISIQVAPGALGRLRYWSPELARYKGRQLTAYYDPEDLKAPVTVFALGGKLACVAENIGNVAFLDTAAAKEHARTSAAWSSTRKPRRRRSSG